MIANQIKLESFEHRLNPQERYQKTDNDAEFETTQIRTLPADIKIDYKLSQAEPINFCQTYDPFAVNVNSIVDSTLVKEETDIESCITQSWVEPWIKLEDTSVDVEPDFPPMPKKNAAQGNSSSQVSCPHCSKVLMKSSISSHVSSIRITGRLRLIFTN